jgi:predicted enzyme related to lactoylglutathione lyase
MANTVVWLDIPVVDLDRAIAFYSAVLGRSIPKHEMPEMSIGVFPHEGPEVAGCLYQSQSVRPSEHGPLLYFNTDGRIDEAIAAVELHGGKVLQPKESIGPYGFRAIVLDSEGNRIALHSH